MATKPSPAPSVLAGIRQAFVAHAPFSAMREAHVDCIVRATTLRYYVPGQTIVAPSAEPPRHAFFIRQGSVRGEPAERVAAHGGALASSWEGTAGELFPLSALLAKRGVTRVYSAVQDTFILAFPATVFDATIERANGLRRLLHAHAGSSAEAPTACSRPASFSTSARCGAMRASRRRSGTTWRRGRAGIRVS